MYRKVLSFKSNDSVVQMDVNSGGVHYSINSSSGGVPTMGKTVKVAIDSSAETVTLTMKPAKIAQEERQERLNKTIRQGAVPIRRSTAG